MKRSIIFIIILLLSFFAFPSVSFAWIDQFNSSASVVIGQVDFVHGSVNQGLSINVNTLSFPRIASVDSGKIVIADRSNNRVLIFNSIPTANNASANVVIGQQDFTHGIADQGLTVDANTLDFGSRRPDVSYAGSKVFIADSNNARVLIYNSLPVLNNVSADVVVGKSNFTTTSCTPLSASCTSNSYGVFSDGTKLFVADTLAARVLIYNSVPTTDNAPADLVLGQSDFSTSTPGCSQSKFNNPIGVYYDGTRLYVSDWSNNRVLIWNHLPTSNGQPADVVVGQTDFDSCAANQGGGIGPNTLSAPHHATWSDGQKLVIADYGNNRVLIYRSIPTANNASADAVIGQVDFNHGLANQGNANPDANTFNAPDGVRVYGNRMFVAEVSNNRVTIFNTGPENPLALINLGAPTTTEHHVNLTLSAEGAYEMMISNNASFSGASWESYAATKEWDLESGNSLKTVYIKFRDFAHFESEVVSASIELPSSAISTELPVTGSNIPYYLISIISAYLLALLALATRSRAGTR